MMYRNLWLIWQTSRNTVDVGWFLRFSCGHMVHLSISFGAEYQCGPREMTGNFLQIYIYMCVYYRKGSMYGIYSIYANIKGVY